MSTFQHNAERMLLWTQHAQPKDWAQYAKCIFDYALQNDPHALDLVKLRAAEAEIMLNALMQNSQHDIALFGDG